MRIRGPYLPTPSPTALPPTLVVPEPFLSYLGGEGWTQRLPMAEEVMFAPHFDYGWALAKESWSPPAAPGSCFLRVRAPGLTMRRGGSSAYTGFSHHTRKTTELGQEARLKPSSKHFSPHGAPSCPEGSVSSESLSALTGLIQARTAQRGRESWQRNPGAARKPGISVSKMRLL